MLPLTHKKVEFSARPHQVKARQAVLDAWEDNIPALLVMATGTGKTLTALHILLEFLEAGERVVWLAHRKELLDQPLRDLRMFWPHIRGGIVQANRDVADAQIVFASVDTLRNDSRLQGILEHGHPAVVVVDEAHHSTSPTHQNAIQGLVQPGTRLLGLTATPDREDGDDLGEHWQIVYSYGLIEAVRDGWLVPPYAAHVPVPDLDLSGVSMSGSDYNAGELGAELIRQGVVEHTVAQVQAVHVAEQLPNRDDQKYIDPAGRSTLVFTATVEQARLTAEALREAGITARYVCGETPKGDRDALVRAFREGRIQVLCNPAVLTEGTDLPIASMAVLARPARSWSLYVQMVGRVLRLFSGKTEGFLLDLGGATKLHNLLAAPVLIGGTRCKKSPNGQHDYVLQGEGPKGVCKHCKGTVACFENLGGHTWADADDGHRACSACGAPQCGESEDGRHHWVPMETGSRMCMDCGVEVPDPLAGMLKKRSVDEPAKAEWLRIPDVTPESWVVDAGDHGLLLVVGDRCEGLWDAYWVKKGGRKARRLASERIPKDLVRTYADDIARRSKKYEGRNPVTWRQRDYAARVGADLSGCHATGEANKEISRAKARRRLLALGLAQEAA